MTFVPNPCQLAVIRAIQRWKAGVRADLKGMGPMTFKFYPLPELMIAAELHPTFKLSEIREEIIPLCDRAFAEKVTMKASANKLIHYHELKYTRTDGLPASIEIRTDPRGTPVPIVCAVVDGEMISAVRSLDTVCVGLTPKGFELSDAFPISPPTAPIVERENDEQSKSPAWERLYLHEENSFFIAELDGESHKLKGSTDGRLLTILKEKRGIPVKANTLETTLGERPSRIFKRLPDPLKAIIEKPGRGQQGYRML